MNNSFIKVVNYMLPKISVITVVRNGAKTLETAIKSVWDQHYENLEYIIIDGGSTDGSVDIIKKHASRLAYWQSQPDKGAGFAQNVGLAKASGEIVAFLFADDWYEPGTLTAIGKIFAENSYLDMVTCGSKIVTRNAVSGAIEVKKTYQAENELDLNLKNILFGAPLIGARFFRKTFLDRIGHFIPADAIGVHNFSNDTELLLRAVLSVPKQMTIDHIGYVYLSHDGSFNFRRHMPTIKRIRREHIAMSEKYLQSTITAEQKNMLNKWQRDQWMRLIFCELYTGQWRAAVDAVKTALKKYPAGLVWPFLTIPFAVVANRLKS